MAYTYVALLRREKYFNLSKVLRKVFQDNTDQRFASRSGIHLKWYSHVQYRPKSENVKTHLMLTDDVATHVISILAVSRNM